MIKLGALQSAISHSRFIQIFQTARTESAFLKSTRSIFETTQTVLTQGSHSVALWWHSSLVFSLTAASLSLIEGFLAKTGVIAGVRLIEAWTSQSFLYRWLTKEPEPDVIVIDLRDTYSVGPILIWLDRAIARCIPITESATVTEMFRSARRYVTRRPVRALSVVIIGSVLADTTVGITTSSLSRQGIVLRVGLLGMALWGTRSTRTLPEILESQTVEFVIKILEPPEPVEPERSRDDGEQDEAE